MIIIIVFILFKIFRQRHYWNNFTSKHFNYRSEFCDRSDSRCLDYLFINKMKENITNLGNTQNSAPVSAKTSSIVSQSLLISENTFVFILGLFTFLIHYFPLFGRKFYIYMHTRTFSLVRQAIETSFPRFSFLILKNLCRV